MSIGRNKRTHQSASAHRHRPTQHGLGGVLTLSQPAKLMGYRPLLAAGASFDEALALAKS